MKFSLHHQCTVTFAACIFHIIVYVCYFLKLISSCPLRFSLKKYYSSSIIHFLDSESKYIIVFLIGNNYFNLHSLASQQDYLNNQWNNYNNDNDNTIKCRNNMNSEIIRVPDWIWTRFPPLFSSVVRSGRVGGQIQSKTLLFLFLLFCFFFFQVHVISTFTRNIHNIISAQWYLPLYILIFQ